MGHANARPHRRLTDWRLASGIWRVVDRDRARQGGAVLLTVTKVAAKNAIGVQEEEDRGPGAAVCIQDWARFIYRGEPESDVRPGGWL